MKTLDIFYIDADEVSINPYRDFTVAERFVKNASSIKAIGRLRKRIDDKSTIVRISINVNKTWLNTSIVTKDDLVKRFGQDGQKLFNEG